MTPCLPSLERIAAVHAPAWRRPVPSCWERVDNGAARPAITLRHTSGLVAILSTDVMTDGSRWLHVSVSRASSLPSWQDLQVAKGDLLGRQSEAVQVLPADRDYVNLHPFCLHLWSPEP